MRLGDFLKRQDQHEPAPTRPVTYRAIGQNPRGEDFTVAVSAVLAFVDEDRRPRSLNAAQVTMRHTYPAGDIPEVELSNEQVYQLLLLALRDATDPRVQLAESVDQLKRSLVKPVAERLYREYQDFVADEFPMVIEPEEFQKLVSESKKSSLSVLLTSIDYSTLRQALPGLAAHFASSPTPTSGGSAPAS